MLLGWQWLGLEGPWKPSRFPKVKVQTSHCHFCPYYHWPEQVITCVHAKLLQLCLTLCDPTDYRLPGSSIHGILQAKIPEWVPCPPPGHLPAQGSNPCLSHLLHWQADSLLLAPSGKPASHRAKPKVNTPPKGPWQECGGREKQRLGSICNISSFAEKDGANSEHRL